MDWVAELSEWFAVHGRDLPWRRPDVSPWGVLVSEIMLQQTPANRVAPAWESWLQRWPDAKALADATPADAVRAWDRLGYPRRAMRLHACACAIVARHGGHVPASLDELLTLPGVGAYTARAVLAFAFRLRAAPVDVNVRRVMARVISGVGDAGPASSARDFATMESILPASDRRAAQAAAAIMELGAVHCVSRNPACDACPVRTACQWRARGYPEYQGTRRPRQLYEGTDRQARGRLLAVLRQATGAVPISVLARQWPAGEQFDRALRSLVADGLATRIDADTYALCGEAAPASLGS